MSKKKIPQARVRRKPKPAATDIDSFVDGGTSRRSKVQKSGRPERQQSTVYLPVDIRKKLKIRAIEDGLEISKVVEDALRAYL